LFISSLVHQSATALMLSLAAWVFFIFVIPNLGTTIAKSIHDVPPSERVEMQGRLAAIQAIYERIQREKNSGEGQEGRRMIQQIREANSQLFESYRPKLNRLVRTTKTIVRVSPAGALTFLITDAANTGLYEELRLKDAISLHVNRNFNRMVGFERNPIENFQYQRASLAEVFSQSTSVDLIILILFIFGLVGLAMIAFLKYDPR